MQRLEGAFLGEGVTRQGGALRRLGDLYADRGSVGRANSSRSQHGVLRENFVVDFSDEVVLAIGIAAPNLSELNGIDRHRIFLTLAEVLPDYRAAREASIPEGVTEGQYEPLQTASVKIWRKETLMPRGVVPRQAARNGRQDK